LNINDFGMKLLERHNWSEKEGALKDIKSVLAGLTEVQLDFVWKKYVETWINNWPPRAAQFETWGREAKANRTPGERHYWKCKCGVLYPLIGEGCPVCGSSEHTKVVVGNSDTPHVESQAECYKCERYGRKFAGGPKCNAWGRMDEPFLPCDECICRPCCEFKKGMDAIPPTHGIYDPDNEPENYLIYNKEQK